MLGSFLGFILKPSLSCLENGGEGGLLNGSLVTYFYKWVGGGAFSLLQYWWWYI